MEPKGPLPQSQNNPVHILTFYVLRSMLMLSSHVYSGLWSGLFPSLSPYKFYVHFSCTWYMPHDLPISSSLTYTSLAAHIITLRTIVLSSLLLLIPFYVHVYCSGPYFRTPSANVFLLKSENTDTQDCNPHSVCCDSVKSTDLKNCTCVYATVLYTNAPLSVRYQCHGKCCNSKKLYVSTTVSIITQGNMRATCFD